MDELKEKILKEGKTVGTEILKVDGFLNHRLDIGFLQRIGEEFKKRFEGCSVDKILTVEASGIAVACMTSPCFGYCPVVFAKKAAPNTMTEGFYMAEARSFTKGKTNQLVVSKEFLEAGENILIIDDFLACGEASLALADIVGQAGGRVAGVGAVIEKGFQGGGKRLREKGYRVESLAVIKEISDGRVSFE